MTIYLSSNTDAVLSFLENNGADPRNVDHNYIEAYVPVTLLGQLSQQPGVARVREIVLPEPHYGPVINQGAQAHGSTVWNQAGITGQGVNVGIIDIGFEGFQNLMGTELPKTVEARCYTDIGDPTNDLRDCEKEGPHGTAVAENIMDIAPGVSLYIANATGSGTDLRNTIKWMISNDVSVINRSLGGEFHGPGDGTSPSYIHDYLDNIDLAAEGGIIFLNAAGNNQTASWFQNSPPSIQKLNQHGHGLIEFAEGDATNSVGFHYPASNTQRLPAGHLIWIYLRWQDTWPTFPYNPAPWSGESTDLDLYLVDSNSGEIIARSEDTQSGTPHDIPTEFIKKEIPRTGQYHIQVAYRGTKLPAWVQILAPRAVHLEHHTKSHSINGPSESANPSMLSVGATHHWDTQTIADYSSQGPTPDGRVKPDIVGVACGKTVSYEAHFRNGYFCWFGGTSQATPQVAGLAALVRQRFPDFTPAETANYLRYFAQQRETPDPNNTWGHGLAQLPSPDREALFALYNATGGPYWTENANWLSTTPIGQWHGVTTNSQGRVTSLNLTSNQIRGAIPPELEDLTSIQSLGLSGNGLTGTIPTWLDNLTNLEELHLRDNHLTSAIPAHLGNLPNLKLLTLSGNQLTNQIPAGLGKLTNLTELDLADNKLTGVIPPELNNLSKLQQLHLWNNGLTGTIPTELGRLTSLETLKLSNNHLDGNIPPDLENLSNLQELYLSDNQLTGTIPAWLGSSTELRELSLRGNQLTGEIPAELGRLENLILLHLAGNHLKGCLPAALTHVEDNDFHKLELPQCGAAPTATATRSLSATTVAPGTEITVKIALSDYGPDGTVTETPPEGFTIISNTIDWTPGGGFDRSTATQVRIVLTEPKTTNVTYKATAPSEARDPSEFTGTFINSNGASVPIGGDSTVTVTEPARTPASYDSNGNNVIDLPELFEAIDDYFNGNIPMTLLFDIIDLYLSATSVA